MQNSTTVLFCVSFNKFAMTAIRKTAAAESKALQKGQQTKAAIVDAALGLATQIGLEGLSWCLG